VRLEFAPWTPSYGKGVFGDPPLSRMVGLINDSSSIIYLKYAIKGDRIKYVSKNKL